MRERRRKNHTKPEGSPAWMVTYGDMVTLILAFFVLLYSFSTIDAQKFKMIISAFQNSLGIIEGGRTFDQSEFIDFGEKDVNIDQNSKEEIEFKKLYEDMKDFIKEKNLLGRVDLELEERGLTIHLMEGAFFDTGKAELKPNSKHILDSLAEKLKLIDKQIRIEGHTDNDPIHTSKFPSNWELSAARAVTVVRYFIEKHGFSPQKLSATGYGEYRPLMPNTSKENKAKNRRVDIVILKTFSTIQEPNQIRK